jgi:AcrR family transcriptional regulator
MMPLGKASKDTQSSKGRILKAIRQLFGKYGFRSATTHMIASEVGTDVATFHYHWRATSDLYDAVILGTSNDVKEMLIKVNKMIRSRSRLLIFIYEMTDYLFKNPELSQLIMSHFFCQPIEVPIFDLTIPKLTSDVAWPIGVVNDNEPFLLICRGRCSP